MAQYETARENPPALVCAVPIVMTLQLDYNAYFPGGVLWNEFANMLGKLGWNVYSQLTARPLKDESWANARKNMVHGEDIRVPMLFIGGWFDIYTDGVLSAFGLTGEIVRSPGDEGFDIVYVTLREADLDRVPESRTHTALEASLNCEVHIRTV